MLCIEGEQAHISSLTQTYSLKLEKNMWRPLQAGDHICGIAPSDWIKNIDLRVLRISFEWHGSCSHCVLTREYKNAVWGIEVLIQQDWIAVVPVVFADRHPRLALSVLLQICNTPKVHACIQHWWADDQLQSDNRRFYCWTKRSVAK